MTPAPLLADPVLAAAAGGSGGFGDNELVVIGSVVLLAALLARLGQRVGLPTIPFFMAAGILLGPGTGAVVLVADPEVLELLATLGLVLLLFHLGVEFPAEQVLSSGGRLVAAGAIYIALNVGAGLALGLALGFTLPESLVLGGALGISSSAIVTKLLVELRRLANVETPVVLGIIVLEDIFLALYLAVLAPVLGDSEGPLALLRDLAISFGFLIGLLLVARFGARAVGWVIGSDVDELLILLFVGGTLAVAGVAEQLGVSDAIGGLLFGLVISRTSWASKVEELVRPLRDAFAALFFIYFGLTVEFDALGDVLGIALLAAAVTLVMNLVAGVVAARLFVFNPRSAINIGMTLLARGEFSLIVVSLGAAAGLDERLGPLVALYVVLLAFASPLLASRSDVVARLLPSRVYGSQWRYVSDLDAADTCVHRDEADEDYLHEPADECGECVQAGDEWVALRRCLLCGHVACCDDSPNRHASGHFESDDHPVVASAEPDESWWWCYVDQVLLHTGHGAADAPEREAAREESPEPVPAADGREQERAG